MRETPYQRLLRIANKWASSVVCPTSKTMWFYPKDRLQQGWVLKDLYERVAAAEQLGYRVELRVVERGLDVVYVKKPEEIPF